MNKSHAKKGGDLYHPFYSFIVIPQWKDFRKSPPSYKLHDPCRITIIRKWKQFGQAARHDRTGTRRPCNFSKICPHNGPSLAVFLWEAFWTGQRRAECNSLCLRGNASFCVTRDSAVHQPYVTCAMYLRTCNSLNSVSLFPSPRSPSPPSPPIRARRAQTTNYLLHTPQSRKCQFSNSSAHAAQGGGAGKTLSKRLPNAREAKEERWNQKYRIVRRKNTVPIRVSGSVARWSYGPIVVKKGLRIRTSIEVRLATEEGQSNTYQLWRTAA